MTTFPSIKDVALNLRIEHEYLQQTITRDELMVYEREESYTDVRLQVTDDDGWALHTGLSDYDQDHRGFWGASSILYGRQNMRELAKDLIGQARDQYAYESSYMPSRDHAQQA